MSRTNQGIFLLLMKEFESLDSEYRNAITLYFGNGRWNCDFFSNLFIVRMLFLNKPVILKI